jgi:uncharacterized protein (TIGR00251 family)
MPLLSVRGGEVLLAVHLQPRAARTELAGFHGDALKIRVAAPPVEGAANDALRTFLAECLGIATSRIRVVRGATSREKLVSLQGLTPGEVAIRLNLPQAG